MTTDNKILGGDDRLKKSTGAGVRSDRAGADSERTDKDGTVFSTSEKRANFRDEWTSTALPQPPGIPGYHLCWLSTTNSYDPIYKRVRMGYEPVRIAETPGFEVYKVKSGEYEGMVGCNEMLLFKVPNELYDEMMNYFHYEKPLEEEEMLQQNQALNDEQGRKVAGGEEDGFNTLVRRAPKPQSFV
jgi:hypothetical protein